MNAKRHTLRLGGLALAGLLALALAATAGAATWIYTNSFGSAAKVREMKPAGAGKNCTKRHGKDQLVIGLSGRRNCGYSPPVEGDSAQPDHVVAVRGRIQPKRTPKALRGAAYVSVKLRMGGGTFYELQVRPKGRRYRVLRKPENATVEQSGKSPHINPLKQMNTLLVTARGARIIIKVNGKRLVPPIVDPNPGQVTGKRIAVGIGSLKSGKRETFGTLKQLRVGTAG